MKHEILWRGREVIIVLDQDVWILSFNATKFFKWTRRLSRSQSHAQSLFHSVCGFHFHSTNIIIDVFCWRQATTVRWMEIGLFRVAVILTVIIYGYTFAISCHFLQRSSKWVMYLCLDGNSPIKRNPKDAMKTLLISTCLFLTNKDILFLNVWKRIEK